MSKITKIEIEKAAAKLLNENIKLKKGEKILLITDRKKCPIFAAFKKILKETGNQVKEIHLSPKREHSSPIPHAKKDMVWANVIIAPTDKSISHSPETYEVRKKYGARVASMPEITEELFTKASKADSRKISELNDKLLKLLKNAKVINIITPSGTDLKMDVRGWKFYGDDNGNISKKGTLNNVPFGEVCGYFDKGVGKITIDYWRDKIKPKDKTLIYLQRGKIMKWNKGAEVLIKELKKAGDCGLKIVELGIGTNKEHKEPIGSTLHDEKIYGTAHIAFGGGGRVRVCPIHEDVILLKPTIWVNGRKIIEKGKVIQQ